MRVRTLARVHSRGDRRVNSDISLPAPPRGGNYDTRCCVTANCR